MLSSCCNALSPCFALAHHCYPRPRLSSLLSATLLCDTVLGGVCVCVWHRKEGGHEPSASVLLPALLILILLVQGLAVCHPLSTHTTVPCTSVQGSTCTLASVFVALSKGCCSCMLCAMHVSEVAVLGAVIAASLCEGWYNDGGVRPFSPYLQARP